MASACSFDRAVPHTVAANDQIEQDPEERQEDQEEHPDRLRHAGEVVIAKEVRDDRDENPDPGEEQKELEDEEQSFAEADVCVSYRSFVKDNVDEKAEFPMRNQSRIN